VFSKSKIFKFLKRDCGTIPVAEIINGKIEIFMVIIVLCGKQIADIAKMCAVFLIFE
jgi:hypothetical protein